MKFHSVSFLQLNKSTCDYKKRMEGREGGKEERREGGKKIKVWKGPVKTEMSERKESRYQPLLASLSIKRNVY